MTQDDVRRCNCAGCDRELSSPTDYRRYRATRRPLKGLPSPVRGRILGRPYCDECLTFHRPPEKPTPFEDSPGPYYDNALRHLEDGGG